MARDIDRKLRLTAAVLGAVSRKDLAAAFRRANPATTFDVARADKWLQGRARPRERQIYEDWATVLGLARPGSWIAECDLDAFLDEVCARHGRDRDDLQRRVDLPGQPPRKIRARRAAAAPEFDLAGAYACYSHAWSPYFRGRLVRGTLSVADGHGGGRGDGRADRATATYVEALPTGAMRLAGALTVDRRALRIEVSDPTRLSRFLHFSLFPPSPPVSVLGGLMFGSTLIGPDAQPSVSRIVLVHLPQATSILPAQDAYLPRGSSLAADLEALGLPMAAPGAVDDALAAFLNVSGREGFDQVPVADYRALVDVFDRLHLAGMGGGPSGGLGADRLPAGDSGTVVSLRPRRRGRS